MHHVFLSLMELFSIYGNIFSVRVGNTFNLDFILLNQCCGYDFYCKYEDSTKIMC